MLWSRFLLLLSCWINLFERALVDGLSEFVVSINETPIVAIAIANVVIWGISRSDVCFSKVWILEPAGDVCVPGVVKSLRVIGLEWFLLELLIIRNFLISLIRSVSFFLFEVVT